MDFSRNPSFGSQFNAQHLDYSNNHHAQYLSHHSSRHDDDDEEIQMFSNASHYNGQPYHRHHSGIAHYENDGYQLYPRHYYPPSSYVPMAEDDFPAMVPTRTNSTDPESLSHPSSASDCCDGDGMVHLPMTPASSITPPSSQSSRHSLTTSTQSALKPSSNNNNSSKTLARRRRHDSSPNRSSPSRPKNTITTTNHVPANNPNPALATTRPHCPHPSCLTPNGHPLRFFSRRADVTRHEKSMHQRCYLDCPKSRCGRKGDNGFTRKDHLTEHLRQYHGMSIGRRGKV